MATIHDLSNIDMSSLSDEELEQLIRQVRSRRRSPDTELKETAKRKAIKKKNNTDALKTSKELLKGITPDMAAALLAQLREKK